MYVWWNVSVVGYLGGVPTATDKLFGEEWFSQKKRSDCLRRAAVQFTMNEHPSLIHVQFPWELELHVPDSVLSPYITVYCTCTLPQCFLSISTFNTECLTIIMSWEIDLQVFSSLWVSRQLFFLQFPALLLSPATQIVCISEPDHFATVSDEVPFSSELHRDSPEIFSMIKFTAEINSKKDSWGQRATVYFNAWLFQSAGTQINLFALNC